MDVQHAFGQIKSAFPTVHEWRGEHVLSFAERNGVILVERKKDGRFYYVLIAEGTSRLIHMSDQSRFKRLKTVGDSFQPSLAYD